MVDILLQLIIYSFLGWCCEGVYCSLGRGEWINRGFLTGPFCPIYGVGAVAALAFLKFLPPSVLVVFLGGMVITSALEYVTSWLMEKLFNARWWDYSKRAFNINGRVCLLNSTLFGLLCLFLYFDLNPRIEQLLGMFNMDFKWGFLVAFFLYFAVDLALAVKSALGINIRLKVLTEIREELQEKYEEWSANAKLDFAQLEEKLLSSDIKDELLEKLHRKQREVGFFERRLMKSFPDMVNRSYPERLEELKNILKKKKLENKK